MKPPVEPITHQLEAGYAAAAPLADHVCHFLQMLPPAAPQLTYDVCLAVHETFINIVEHAYGPLGGPVWLTLTYAPDARLVEVTLRDNGRSFDPGAITCPDPARLQAGGYGLFLVSQLTDEMHYTAHATGNTWRLRKRWAG